MKYDIHDNGGVPFKVHVTGHKVLVYKNDDKTCLFLFQVEADKAFIGKQSPDDPLQNGPNTKSQDGNSILLKLGSSYRYIGHEIYDFHTIEGDTITKFYSDIGNSDVPYPYAIGKQYIYFMLEKIAIEKSFFDMSVGHLYEQSYFAQRIRDCLYAKRTTKNNMCKDKNEYMPTLKELKDKTVKLKTKLIQSRNI